MDANRQVSNDYAGLRQPSSGYTGARETDSGCATSLRAAFRRVNSRA